MTRWLKAYGRPRQKVMIIAGRGSRDLASRREVTSCQEDRCHNTGRCQNVSNISRCQGIQEMPQMSGLEAMRI